jgi:catechol 2,3-dioxygenase-like lactoylglutathione lyase family enzyme
MAMEQRVSLITLGVADLARSLRFYEALGWRRGNDHAEVAFFQAGGLVLGLFARAALAADAGLAPEGSGFRGSSLAYNTRTRAEVDAVLAEAAAAGATIVKPAEDTFWGGYSGYFADPDDHLWEVAWNPHWTILEDGAIRLGG